MTLFMAYDPFKSGLAFRWWQCPNCGDEVLYSFESFLPEQFLCTHCQKNFFAPWPAAKTTSWRCKECGHLQEIGIQSASRGKCSALTIMGRIESAICCLVCH